MKGLERASENRNDEHWVKSKLYSDDSVIVPVHQLNVLCQLTKATLKAVSLNHSVFDQEQLKDAIFLGVHDDTACFALALANSEDATVLTEKYSAEFVDLKSHMALLNNYDCELLMLARFYVYWHGRHQYCGQCGQLTRSAESGHVRMCDDKECNQ